MMDVGAGEEAQAYQDFRRFAGTLPRLLTVAEKLSQLDSISRP